jgi:release factor H-coupled RctB family protein
VICENRDLLRQEHGKAYKDIEQVISDMKDLGLLEVVAVLKPVLTYKTRAETDDGDG